MKTDKNDCKSLWITWKLPHSLLSVSLMLNDLRKVFVAREQMKALYPTSILAQGCEGGLADDGDDDNENEVSSKRFFCLILIVT